MASGTYRDDSRPWWAWLAGGIAIVFGVATLLSGGQVLFGNDAARAAAGAYVPFVLWFNFIACVYRKFDSGWTRRTDGISSRPDEGSAQADSRRPAFALQVESKAGSRNPDPAATDQCASPAGTETTALQQYRSFSVCLALSLVPLRPWRDSDYQARDNHSLAPRWISSVLALAIAQPCWQTEGFG